MQEQPDGLLLVSGGWGYIMGNGPFGSTIVRLRENGLSDVSFSAATYQLRNFYGGSGTAWLQPDGKIITHCSNGTIARLNPDGSLDATFASGTADADGTSVIVMQPNGQLLISGSFTSYNG